MISGTGKWIGGRLLRKSSREEFNHEARKTALPRREKRSVKTWIVNDSGYMQPVNLNEAIRVCQLNPFTL